MLPRAGAGPAHDAHDGLRLRIAKNEELNHWCANPMKVESDSLNSIAMPYSQWEMKYKKNRTQIKQLQINANQAKNNGCHSANYTRTLLGHHLNPSPVPTPQQTYKQNELPRNNENFWCHSLHNDVQSYDKKKNKK
jgi:hypothetical protein